MQAIHHILVPIDFGEASDEAVEYALSLAAKFDANLLLVHVYALPVYAYASEIYVPADDLSVGAKSSTSEAEAHVRARWPRTDSVLVEGTAWQQILKVAADRRVDLIVMGTHGRHGLSRMLLGSVAEKIVRLSPVPVLTVRAPAGPEVGDRPGPDADQTKPDELRKPRMASAAPRSSQTVASSASYPKPISSVEATRSKAFER